MGFFWILATYCFLYIVNCSISIESSCLSYLLNEKKSLFLLETGLIINDLGNYDECLKTENSTYILINIASPFGTASAGHCVSNVCSAEDYNENILPYIKNQSIILKNVAMTAIEPKKSESKLDNGGIAILSVLGLIIALNLFGNYWNNLREEKEGKETLLEKENTRENMEISHKKNNRFISKVLVAFDLKENIKKLFTLRSGKLDFFNCIRSLSLFYVVFGHEFLLRLSWLTNYQDVPSLMKGPLFLLVAGGFYAVDVFYYLSGFFMAFVLLDSKKRILLKKPLTYLWAIIHRYLRIMPCYVLAMLFYWKIIPLLGDGPLFSFMGNSTEVCVDMWKNVIFIDDFSTGTMGCFGWGWYLSTDFHLFIFCLILIGIYNYSPKIGCSLLALSCIGSFIYGLVFFKQNNYGFVPYVLPTNADLLNKWMKDYYTQPYARGPPYFLGLFIGIGYREYQNKNGFLWDLKNFLVKYQFFVYILNAIGLFLVNFLIFAPNLILQDNEAWSLTGQQIIMTFCRFLYVFGIFLITISLLLELNDIIGKLIKKIMGISIWGYIAKISFCSYLIHYFIIQRNLFNYKQSSYFNEENLVGWSVADMTFTLIFAIPLSLFVEIPFMNIVK